MSQSDNAVFTQATGSPVLTFNMLLECVGIAPRDVRLLRHQGRGPDGSTAYGLWRDDQPSFDAYQAAQQVKNRSRLAAPYWASFVVAPDGRTLFAGLYSVADDKVPVPAEWPYPLSPRPPEGDDELYQIAFLNLLDTYVGRVAIDWGGATRTWVQRADAQDKAIVELTKTFEEPEFPGFSAFVARLSDIETLPDDWITALRSASGIYVLTCPRTNELYVGSATNADGFLGRWREYAANGHGGNVMLRSRERSDYQVSILEVAGSFTTDKEILALESQWKRKLQVREMGLCAN